MNLIDQLAVDACFRFRDAVEDLESGVPHTRLQRGFLEKLTDLGPRTSVIMAVISVVMMVVGVIVWAFDDETGAGDSAAHSALGFEDDFFG